MKWLTVLSSLYKRGSEVSQVTWPACGEAVLHSPLCCSQWPWEGETQSWDLPLGQNWRHVGGVSSRVAVRSQVSSLVCSLFKCKWPGVSIGTVSLLLDELHVRISCRCCRLMTPLTVFLWSGRLTSCARGEPPIVVRQGQGGRGAARCRSPFVASR